MPSKPEILSRCRAALPGWQGLPDDAFTMEAPKGFSSFTLSIRCTVPAAEPPAVLYRQLTDKDNAILDGPLEREVFLQLVQADIAPHCYHYSADCRLESFYEGRTLTREDVRDPDALRGIANALYRYHRLPAEHLPEANFFTLLHQKWGPLARATLVDHRDHFPENERRMCDELLPLLEDETRRKVARCIPNGPQVFCHNDTYHGNVMKLTDGSIRLLDFEFSCRNHPAFDFSNLFAETVMRHKLPDYPYFDIAEPEFTETEIGTLVGFYLDNEAFDDPSERQAQHNALVSATMDLIMLSDYMYAMAALPLALAPIQKIPFIAYAHRRFHKFLAAYEARGFS